MVVGGAVAALAASYCCLRYWAGSMDENAEGDPPVPLYDPGDLLALNPALERFRKMPQSKKESSEPSTSAGVDHPELSNVAL